MYLSKEGYHGDAAFSMGVIEGSSDNETLGDGWTVVTKDKSLSAHLICSC